MIMKHCNKFYAVRIWFLLNVFVSLYPPFYWAAGTHQPLILGLPVSLIYFGTVSISITFSILFAYWQEYLSGELSS